MRKKKQWKNVSISEKERIQALRLQGLSYPAIAERTGRSLTTCWRYRPAFGGALLPRKFEGSELS